MIYDFPRKARIDFLTPAETAIHEAIQKIEIMDADTRLTDAILLLIQAQDKVAEYVDGSLEKYNKS